MKFSARVFAAGVGAVALAFSATSFAQTLKPVDIGLSSGSSLVNLPCFVALQGGFFDKHGLKVSFVDSQGGSKAAAATLSGNVGLSCTGGSYAIDAARQGQSLKFVLPLLTQLTLTLTVSNEMIKDRGITSQMPPREIMTRLKGIKIGSSNPGSSSDQFARYLIETNNLDPDRDFRIVPIGANMANIVTAFERKVVDAASYSSPIPEYIETQKMGVSLISAARGDLEAIRGAYYCGVLVNEAFAKKNPEIVQAAVNAIAEAQLFIRREPDKARDIAAQYAKPKNRAMFDAAFDSMARAVPAKIEPMAWTGFEKLITYAEKAEGTKGAAVKFDDIARNDFIQGYLAGRR